MAIKAVPPAKNPRKGTKPRITVRRLKIMEYCAKNPAKRFERGETREISPKTNAEIGSTARKATELTQKASIKKFAICFPFA